jgi:phenylpropionate dioxygenase-like ring-hydroxylating dioxygenase large terminal subunit
MVHAWEIETRHRITTVLQTGQQDMVEHVTHLRPEDYTSRERLELERRRVFGRFPLLVGFSAQVRSPGDFFTHDLTGVPILVTRDKGGVLRAFLNVCRHRAAKVTDEPCGSGKSTLTCRYHGWTYGIGGELRAIPQLKAFPDVRLEERGLIPLPVDEVAGLVFIRTTPGSELRAREFLGPLVEQLEDLNLGRRIVFESSTHQANGNWKLMVDANLESYHIPSLHKNSGAMFLEAPNIYEASPPHGRGVLPYKESAKAANPVPIDEMILQHAGLLYNLFPNTVVFFLGRFAHVLSTFPVDEHHAVVRGASLMIDGPLDDTARTYLRHAYEGYWTTIQEDLVIVESIQKGLRSGANRELLVGRHEFAVRDFHASLDAAIQGRLHS